MNVDVVVSIALGESANTSDMLFVVVVVGIWWLFFAVHVLCAFENIMSHHPTIKFFPISRITSWLNTLVQYDIHEVPGAVCSMQDLAELEFRLTRTRDS